MSKHMCRIFCFTEFFNCKFIYFFLNGYNLANPYGSGGGSKLFAIFLKKKPTENITLIDLHTIKVNRLKTSQNIAFKMFWDMFL